MAKSEKKKEAGGISLTSDNVDAHLKKKFGDGIFVGGDSIVNSNRIIVPFSPALDLILGGGIQEGSFCIFTGPPKVGKTTSCLDFAGTAQGLQYAPDFCPKGRHVYFFNVEGRLQARDLVAISNLTTTPDRMTVIRSEPGRILVAENYLEILEAFVHTKPGAIFVIDSLSQLCSHSRMTANIGDRFRDDVPLMLASLTKRISNVLPINKCIVLAVTHRIANQDPKSQKKWTEASGQKVQYAVDTKLNATYAKPYMESSKEDAAQIGQEIFWDCSASPLGPPGGKTTSLLRYGYGLDKAWELVKYSKEIGLLKAAGAWIEFPDGSKVQGQEKATDLIRNDKKLYQSLSKQFREMMGMAA